MKIEIAKKILGANDEIAKSNRQALNQAGVFAINLVGSPGAGKTSLLEALCAEAPDRSRIAVIEGDLATSNDADRIEGAQVRCVQINTEKGCHLDAGMVALALKALPLDEIDLLIIENVGNLVCTAGFDLGEHLRIVLLSVAEGDDKVEKYPPMFSAADCLLIGKIDLLPYVDFDVQRARKQLRILNPNADFLQISAKTGQGIAQFAQWIRKKSQAF